MRFIKEYPRDLSKACHCGCEKTVYRFDGSKSKVSLYCKKCGNKLEEGR